MVIGTRIEDVNLGSCHKEVFKCISTCKNTKSLFLYDIKDDSVDDSDIIQGITSVLPKLVNLKQLDIRGVYLDDRGKDVIDSIQSDLRILFLCDTHLSGSGSSLVSCLSHLPLLSYLNLFDSGLSKVELNQILQVIPTSCPSLLGLQIAGTSFNSVESKPLFLLKHLRSLAFASSSAEDLIKTLEKLPKTIQLLYLMDRVTILYILDQFVSVIQFFTRLKFLVVNKGCLDSGGEQNVSDVLKQSGGRFVNSDTDPQGWENYQDQITILKNECFKDT